MASVSEEACMHPEQRACASPSPSSKTCQPSRAGSEVRVPQTAQVDAAPWLPGSESDRSVTDGGARRPLLLFDDRIAVELVDDAVDRQVLVAASDGEMLVVAPNTVVLGERQLYVDTALAVAALAEKDQQLARRGTSVVLDGLVRGTEQMLAPLAMIGGQE